MQVLTVCCVLGMIGSLSVVESYTTKYDHLDIEMILNNKRLVSYYAACFMSEGPCTPDALVFKGILPEAIQTNCAKCTDKQKTVTLRAMKRLKKEYPKVFKQLESAWDPDGIYFEKFINTFDSHGLPTTAAPEIFNRFGDEQDTNEVIASSTSQKPLNAPYPPAISSTTTRSIASSTIRTTTIPSTTTTTATTTTKVTTNGANTASNNINYTTIKPRPTGVIATNLQATVSLGTNIVGGIVKGLGDLGIKVIDSGVQFTEMVLKGVRSAVTPRRYL